MENKRQRNLYLIIAFFKNECVVFLNSYELWIMMHVCLNVGKWTAEEMCVQ